MEAVVQFARSEDADSICSLMRRVINSTVEPSLRRGILENVEENVGIWLVRPLECVHLVAELHGSIVGVVLVKDFWNLCSLFVEQATQGEGIGTALMKAAIAECEGRSPRNALLLNAYPSAIGFYERLGFASTSSAQNSPSGVQAMELVL